MIGGRGEFIYSTWLGMILNAHVYTIIPDTYLLFGLGGVLWPTNSEEPDQVPSILRLGIGVGKPVSKRFNVRVEADLLGGINAHFEYSIR